MAIEPSECTLTKKAAVFRFLVMALPDIKPAREHPPFRRMLFASLLSSLGSTMTTFAVTLEIWQLSHSSLYVGLLGAAKVAPVFTVGMFGGSMADSFDRRRLVIAGYIGLAIVSMAFAVQAFFGFEHLWLLYLLSLFQGFLRAVGSPARRTFTALILPPHQLASGIALDTLIGQVVLLAGPALAGLISASVGLKLCYAIDAASFAPALYSVARLPVIAKGRVGARPFQMRTAAAGIAYMARHPVLAAAFLCDLNAMLLGLPVAMFPALNALHFGGSPVTLGLLTTAVGAGGVACAVVSGAAQKMKRPGRGMLASTLIWGAAIAVFGLTRSFSLAFALLAIAGAADTITIMFGRTIAQTLVTDEFRGRVAAIEYAIGTAGGPVGNVESGVVANFTSPVISVVSGGIACALVSLLIAGVFPGFRSYRRESELAASREAGPPSHPGTCQEEMATSH
jgi:MFS family permease